MCWTVSGKLNELQLVRPARQIAIPLTNDLLSVLVDPFADFVRFALGFSKRQATDFMMAVVKNMDENLRSTVYDEFQWVSTGGALRIRGPASGSSLGVCHSQVLPRHWHCAPGRYI
jgi:hypothetical protein